MYFNKKIGEFNIFCAININIYIDTLSKSLCLGGPLPLLAPLVPPVLARTTRGEITSLCLGSTQFAVFGEYTTHDQITSLHLESTQLLQHTLLNL